MNSDSDSDSDSNDNAHEPTLTTIAPSPSPKSRASIVVKSVARVDWTADTVRHEGEWVFIHEFAARKHGLNGALKEDCGENGRDKKENVALPEIQMRRSNGPAGRHAVAARKIPRVGTLLLECSGATVVKVAHTRNVCGHCLQSMQRRRTSSIPSGKSTDDRLRGGCSPVPCSGGCGTAWYCSTACERKAAGSGHDGLLCGALRMLAECCPQLPFELDLDAGRLALTLLAMNLTDPGTDGRHDSSNIGDGRVGNEDAFREEMADGKDVTRPPFDLVSHSGEVADDAARAAVAGGAVLLRLLNIENADAKFEAAAGELLLQLRFNTHPIDSLLREDQGLALNSEVSVVNVVPGALLGLFPDAARLNHSCRPTAVLAWRAASPSSSSLLSSTTTAAGDEFLCGKERDSPRTGPGGAVPLVLEARSVRPLEEGEEVTFSYLSAELCSKVAQRRELLLAGFLFHCQCDRCQSEEPYAATSTSSSAAGASSVVENAMRELANATGEKGLSSAASTALGKKHVGRLLSIAASDHKNSSSSSSSSSKGDSVALRADAASAALVAARLAKDSGAEAAAARWAAQAWADAGLPLDLRRGDFLATRARTLVRGFDRRRTRTTPGQDMAQSASNRPMRTAYTACDGSQLTGANKEGLAAAEEAAAEALSIYMTALGTNHPRVQLLRSSLQTSRIVLGTGIESAQI